MSRARVRGMLSSRPCAVRTGEFYNNESKMLAAVSKFKKDPLTKGREHVSQQLLASASKTASQYCSSDMWSPCVTDDSEYDKAGIV
eukprot:765092-Hanusia_phi.AAC.2